MQRRILVVGDPPALGGRVLAYAPPFTKMVMGHQVAIIGGRVYCQNCDSIGVISKSGGPRRMGYITEVALEGDLCVCQCAQPQPLISTLQRTSSCDDTDCGVGLGFALWKKGEDKHLAAQKLVDEQVQYPSDVQAEEPICPNMTNAAFVKLVLELRDEAVVLVGLRLSELARWDKTAQDRILEWFGDPGFGMRTAHLNDLRGYLRSGLNACERVLRGLQPSNFVRWSPTAHRHIACVPAAPMVGLAAQVCKPDVATHTIAIGPEFCGLTRSSRIFGTDDFYDKDTQLLTLIHEVTHFDDVFGSTDDWYKTGEARASVKRTGRLDIARVNADSLSGYVLGTQEP